jgi:hypothetical protein
VVTVTDPAGKWGKTTANAMGAVTQVDQPNPAGGANLVSTTTYDLVGHVIQTQQIRGAVTLNRTATDHLGFWGRTPPKRFPKNRHHSDALKRLTMACRRCRLARF